MATIMTSWTWRNVCVKISIVTIHVPLEEQELLILLEFDPGL